MNSLNNKNKLEKIISKRNLKIIFAGIAVGAGVYFSAASLHQIKHGTSLLNSAKHYQAHFCKGGSSGGAGASGKY